MQEKYRESETRLAPDPQVLRCDPWFLDAAAGFVRRLSQTAIRNAGACSWPSGSYASGIETASLAPARIVGGLVYDGSAGIALFLIEYFRLTEDAGVHHLAVCAVEHALAQAEALPAADFGFFAGRVGIAYAAAQLGSALGEAKYVLQAQLLLRACAGSEARERGIDVITGAAGAIPALLRVSSIIEPESSLAMAEALGSRLIALAQREAVGWSWNCRDRVKIRNLTGFGHGAAGIGHAFVELFASTGDERYAFAAEQAFAYERQFFSAARGNWLDVRHHELARLLYLGEDPETLTSLIRGAANIKFRRSYQYGWCYGAAGFTLSRIRAYAVLRNSIYLHEARAGIRTCISAAEKGKDYSLVRGLGGVCDALIQAAHSWDEPNLRCIAASCLRRGIDAKNAGEGPVSDGGSAQPFDPTLMTGLAGIGYLCTRLAHSSVQSILALSTPAAGISREEGNVCHPIRVRTRFPLPFFRRTIRVLTALGKLPDTWRQDIKLLGSAATCVQAAVYSYVLARIDAETATETRELLRDAFALDRLRYEAALNIGDVTDKLISDLRLTILEQNHLIAYAVFAVRRTTRIFDQRRDWDSWLAQKPSCRAALPAFRHRTILLYLRETRTHWSVATPLAVWLVQRLRKQPASSAHLAGLLPRSLADRSRVPDSKESSLTRELRRLCRRGVIEVTAFD